MATIDRTINGGGTVGHPSRMPSPYVVTSQVHDTADGGTGGGNNHDLLHERAPLCRHCFSSAQA